MPNRSKVVALAALVAIGLIIPLFGDPRVTPLTHPLWARMLLRALDMDEAVQSSTRASTIFDTLAGRRSRFYPADAFWRADGVTASGTGANQRLSTRGGVGEVSYALPIVHGGDYTLRARVAGDPAHPISAEVAPLSGAPALRAFQLVPARQSSWILGGSVHIDPGTYKASLLLPADASVEYLEVAPPCVNPIEPMGGWQAAKITTADDLAVTALRALDREDALAPADSPIERTGADFETDALTPAGAGFEKSALTAGSDGLKAMLAVDIPEPGLYTIEAFVNAGAGQRWQADGCRKVVLCAGSPGGWRSVMTQSFSATRHTFAVSLTDGATVERVRITRRKETPADYVAALSRLGFDAGEGTVSRASALEALKFVRQANHERQAHSCGDVADPRAPAAPPITTVAAAPVSGGSGAPPPAPPLSSAMLPPQERESPVLPGPTS